MDKIKTIAAALLIGVTGLGKLEAQEKKTVEFQSNLNSIEASVNTPNQEPHIRLVNSNAIQIGKVNLAYNGLNEVDLADFTTYYGEHTPTLGFDGVPVEATSKLETTVDGVDVKYGINIPLPEKTGLYGNVSLTANKKGADIIAFVGKDFADGKFLIEIYNKTMFSKNEINNYAELQSQIKVAKNLYAIGRISFDNKTVLQGNVGVNFMF